jgi:hydroxymethylpyrimidine pyrophosphatase-like HAD family hydrolase
MNDTSMFKEAGLSLCAGIGSEDAKALATMTICPFYAHTAKHTLELLKKL